MNQIIDRIQPYVDQYVLATTKCNFIRNRPPKDAPFSLGETNQILALEEIIAYSEKQIMRILFEENEERVSNFISETEK